MKNSADQGGRYPQRPKAEVDNTLRDLQNSSYPTKAEFNNCFIIHSKYFPVLKGVSPFRSLFFCLPKITQSRLQVFFGQRFNNLQQAALFTSLIQYDEDSFQQLVMVNYACGFNQSETGKYFELIMNQCHNMAPRLSGQLLYSVLFSLYSSLFYESRERKKLKIYNYDPKVSEPC